VGAHFFGAITCTTMSRFDTGDHPFPPFHHPYPSTGDLPPFFPLPQEAEEPGLDGIARFPTRAFFWQWLNAAKSTFPEAITYVSYRKDHGFSPFLKNIIVSFPFNPLLVAATIDFFLPG